MKETTTWYTASRFNRKVGTVEVVKETAKSLVILQDGWRGPEERRVMKDGDTSYHRTEEEAAGAMIRRAREALEATRRRLQYDQSTYGNLKGLYPNHPEFKKGGGR